MCRELELERVQLVDVLLIKYLLLPPLYTLERPAAAASTPQFLFLTSVVGIYSMQYIVQFREALRPLFPTPIEEEYFVIVGRVWPQSLHQSGKT